MPTQALQPADRARLLGMDQTVHLVSRRAASAHDGCGRGRTVPDPSRGDGTGGGGNAEPGPVGDPVLVQRGIEYRFAVAGVGHARKTTAAATGGVVDDGSTVGAVATRWPRMVDGESALRHWHALDGMRAAAGEGRRLLAQ